MSRSRSSSKRYKSQRQSKEKLEVEKQFRETYLQICQGLGENPNNRLYNNIKFEPSSSTVVMDNCNISEKCIKAVVFTLMKLSGRHKAISIANNQFFKDYCLKQVIEYLVDSPNLRGLSLEKISASDSHFLQLIQSLPQTHLLDLNISSNHMSYFCFDQLANLFQNHQLSIRLLDLSNTKLQDKNGIDLFSSIIFHSQVSSLNLARNPGLAFKFTSAALAILSSTEEYSLQHLDISYCGISATGQRQILRKVYQNACRIVGQKEKHFCQERARSLEGSEYSTKKTNEVVCDDELSHLNQVPQQNLSFINIPVMTTNQPVPQINLYSSEESNQPFHIDHLVSYQSNNNNRSSISKQKDSSYVSASQISPSEEHSTLNANLNHYNCICEEQKIHTVQELQKKTPTFLSIHQPRSQSNGSQVVYSGSSVIHQTEDRSLMSSYSNNLLTAESVPQEKIAYQLGKNQTLMKKEFFGQPKAESKGRRYLDSISQDEKERMSAMCNSQKRFRKEDSAQKLQRQSRGSSAKRSQSRNKKLENVIPETKHINLYAFKNGSNENSYSPNKYSIHQNYYRDQRKQAKILKASNQSYIQNTTKQQNFKDQLNKLSSINLQNRNIQNLEYSFTPQILKKNDSSKFDKENKYSSGSKQIPGQMSIQSILRSQKEKIDSLKTERYSQMRRPSSKKKIDESSSVQKLEQRYTPLMRSSSRNGTSSRIFSIENTPYRQNFNINTTQRQYPEPFCSTTNGSNMTTIRCQNSQSQFKLEPTPSDCSLITNGKAMSDLNFNSQLQDPNQLKALIKNEIQRLQSIYQTIDTVLNSNNLVTLENQQF